MGDWATGPAVHTIHMKFDGQENKASTVFYWQIQTTHRESQKTLDVSLKEGKKSREVGGVSGRLCMC